MKKPAGSKGTFQSQDHYARVRQQQGKVQTDSDWNESGQSRPSSFLRKAPPVLGVAVGVTALVVAAVLIGPAIAARLRFPPQTMSITLVQPEHGSVVPLHSTIGVQGEAASSQSISRIELWVNSQLWASREFDPALRIAAAVLNWTPSGEGQHELLLRAFDANGRSGESQRVRVLAMAQADVRFPLEYQTRAGDNVDALAEAAGIDPQDILDANPGLPPLASLPAGMEITLPVPVPNAPETQPEGGDPAMPPVQPVSGGGDEVLPFLAGLHIVSGGPSAPGFWFYNGTVAPGTPVDWLYLYVALDEGAWERIPGDPHAFLFPVNGLFDITAYLDISALEASPTPVRLRAEAWGWKGGTIVYLGSYDGLLGGGSRAWSPKDTSLKILTYQALGIPHYAGDINLTGEDPSLTVDFEWETTAPNASLGRWQVSVSPFPLGVGLNPPGLIHEGTIGSADDRFTLNFREYLDTPGGGGGFGLGGLGQSLQGAWEDLTQGLSGQSDPTAEFAPSLPQTFYVRMVPLSGAAPLVAIPTGEPSNTVIVRYLPTGESLPEGPIGGPIYEARIVAFTSYRAADPGYAACMVSTKDILFPPMFGLSSTIPAGSLSCGCPGVSCGGGGSDCGEFSLDGFSDCVSDVGSAFVGALEDLASFGADLYNGAKDFIVDTLSAGLCNEDALGGVIGEDECKLAVNIGVNAGLAAIGLPPEIPNLNQLFSQGLEYAIANVATQITGFECDATCRSLLKKGFEGASNPEALFDEGLAYGAGLAADELGAACDAECEALIEGAAGGLTSGNLSDAALAAAAHQAAAALHSQGYACDANCEADILDKLQDGASLGQAAAQSSANAPPEPHWVPHELALEQPPIVTVEIFRRWESAGATSEELSRCGVSIDNQAENQAGGLAVSGRAFEPKGIDLPVIGPGESMRFPVILDRAPWVGPPEYLQASAAELAAELSAESGIPVMIGSIYDPVLRDWSSLYYGSTVSFRLWGPFVLSMAGGEMQSVPCVAEEASWTQSIPNMP